MYSVSIKNIENNAVPRMNPATFAPADGLDPEDPEAHQRLRVALLPDDEAGQQHERSSDHREGLHRDPPVLVRTG